jgi:RND superfamily putative drug exporter
MSAPINEPTTEEIPVATQSHPFLPRNIRKFAVFVIVGWIAIIGLLNVIVPQLEEVGQLRSVSMSPNDAPSVISMKEVGAQFKEFKSNSSVMIVLEGQEQLGADAHKYYDQIVDKLEADTKHVEHVQDFWSDPLTGAGSQSNDGKAAYVQVYLAGNMGESLANESVEAVQKMVDSVQAPNGVKAYVTGPGALQADQQVAGDRSMQLIEMVTFSVIIILLLLVYRSIMTVGIVLVMVVLQLAAARGVVAFLGYHEIIGLSTFATNLLVTLAIAAATDYAIFLIGRYQEARGAGEDRESAYYTMFGGTAHVILGSGMTIAGATFCLHFTRLPYFQTLGVPLAIGMVICVSAALTLGPALITLTGRFLEPKRAMRVRGWRKIGAAVVRWPGPILVGTIALALVGLLTLPGYRTNYNDRNYLPQDLPSNEGYAAADRHFSQARMNPELLMIESDHDLRNSADFLVIDKIAKAVFRVPGIARVQAITRPLGTPMTKMSNITKQMADLMHDMVGKMKNMTVDVAQLRDYISNFDDFFRPLRNYFYWEPHCFNIPVCFSIRSIFDTLDGIDTMTTDIQELLPVMERLDVLMPQMVALMPPMIDTMKNMKRIMLTMYATQKGMQDQTTAMQENQSAMGEAFDASKNDDSFYLPPEAFNNAEFKRGMKNFISPDGKSVRFIISHEGDPMSQEGISHIDAIKQAAKEAVKGTPLEGSKVYLAGTAATFKDMADGSMYDLMIRRDLRARPDLHHHVDHHQKRGGIRRHRGHGAGVARRVVRPVGAHLAAHPRDRIALDGAGDVRHHPVGRWRRLQPAVGSPIQRGDTRRAEHRHHPRDGWHGVGGDLSRVGVRLHDDVHGGQ